MEVEVFDVDYFETHDTFGKERIGIKLFFKRRSAYLSVKPELVNCISHIGERLVDYGFKMIAGTERKGLITSRVVQGAYRKGLFIVGIINAR